MSLFQSFPLFGICNPKILISCIVIFLSDYKSERAGGYNNHKLCPIYEAAGIKTYNGGTKLFEYAPKEGKWIINLSGTYVNHILKQ